MTDSKAEEALKFHRKLGGKLRVETADSLDDIDKLGIYYTPGVGDVSRYVHEHPESARELTGLNNSVAVISDGSAVLGLGNIGPQAALPVMEGKCMLFKHFADINAFPIVIDVHSADEIIMVAAAIAPSFGGINLEDIAAPICFEVEDRLKTMLDIPVFHDDQHGTAVVVLAGLINAAKVVKKQLEDLRVVVSGAGAAGSAVIKVLHRAGLRDLLVLDSRGIIANSQPNLRPDKALLASLSNPNNKTGSLLEALEGADAFIGVSKPDLVTAAGVKTMADDPIIFALSNPNPEILPNEAMKGGARVVATGRSDFPNQVNNSLAFPGLFRGALDNKLSNITEDHKVAAAKALAALIDHPTPEEFIPRMDHPGILAAVSSVVV